MILEAFYQFSLLSPLRLGIDTLERCIAPGDFQNSGEKFEHPKCQPRNRTASVFDNRLVNGEDLAMLWLYRPTDSG